MNLELQPLPVSAVEFPRASLRGPLRPISRPEPEVHQVRVLMPMFGSPSLLQVARSIEAALHTVGSRATFLDTPDAAALDRQLARTLKEGSADGMLVFGAEPRDERILEIHALRMPVVSISSGDLSMLRICVDEVEAGQLLSRALSDGNCSSQVLLIENPRDWITQERARGFKSVCPSGGSVIEWDEAFERDPRSLLERLFDRDRPSGGIACATDSLAIRVQSLLGPRIRDAQLVCIDDSRQCSRLNISAVDQPLELLGQLAVQALAQLMRSEPASSQVLSQRVVHRGTTRPRTP